MKAGEFAGIVTEVGLRRDPAVIERLVLDGEPEYSARVHAIAKEHASRIRNLRARVVAELRAVDPAAAKAVSTPWPRSLALLGSALSAAAAYALYFSRAEIDAVAVVPLAVLLVVVAVGLYAAALLPARRTDPPPVSLFFVGWIVAGLSAATVATVARLVAMGVDAVVWLVVGVIAVTALATLAGVCTWARSGITRRQRLATEARVRDLPAELLTAASAELDAAFDAVRQAYDALPADRRRRLEADLAAAAAVLEQRELLGAGRPSAQPGLGIVAEELRVAAISIGVRGLEPPAAAVDAGRGR